MIGFTMGACQSEQLHLALVGDVEIGQSSTQVVTISNSGGAELSDIFISDDPFTTSIGSFTLAGGGRQEVTIQAQSFAVTSTVAQCRLDRSHRIFRLPFSLFYS